MIAHYYVAYNERPVVLARRIKETMTVTIFGRHTGRREEKVSEETRIHLFNGETLTVADFLVKFLPKS